MKRPPIVISIQSQVVFGHVGNSAAVFPMQAAGLEVVPVPTVLLSNTPRHATLRGRALPADLFADLLLGMRERGLMERASFLITGYIGSLDVAKLAADFVAEAKAANPALVYLCDPVMGDEKPGLYIAESIANTMRDRLLPLADIVTPNQFETSWLSGLPARSFEDLLAARAALPLPETARLIATGCALEDTPAGCIESVILGPKGGGRHPTPDLDVALSGTGDLFAGLVVAGLGAGLDLPASVERAQRLTAVAMRHAIALGAREVVLSAPGFREALLSPERA